MTDLTTSPSWRQIPAADAHIGDQWLTVGGQWRPIASLPELAITMFADNPCRTLRPAGDDPPPQPGAHLVPFLLCLVAPVAILFCFFVWMIMERQ